MPHNVCPLAVFTYRGCPVVGIRSSPSRVVKGVVKEWS